MITIRYKFQKYLVYYKWRKNLHKENLLGIDEQTLKSLGKISTTMICLKIRTKHNLIKMRMS